MLITKLVINKKNTNLVDIYIEDEYFATLNNTDVFNLKLIKGKDISFEDIREIKYKENYQICLSKAINYISYKPRTKKEVERKLKQDNFDDYVIENVINKLKEYNYIDDKKYIESFINNKLSSKPIGKYRIKQELIDKGIDRVIIEEKISEYEIDDLHNIIMLIKKKIKDKNQINEIKYKRRLINFLLRRGFDLSSINKGIDLFLKDNSKS